MVGKKRKIISFTNTQWGILLTDNSLYQIIPIDNLQIEVVIVHRLSVFSNLHFLVRLNWVVFPLGAIPLARCEHSNRTQVQTKTTALKPLKVGGLGLVPNKLWSGSFVVET